MSGLKKLLLGGAVCCLIASLIVPIPSGNGTDTNSEVSAGIRPKYRKPWLKKKPVSKKKQVKSYPIPDENQQTGSQPDLSSRPELDLLTQPAETETFGSGNPKSVMQELQELYEQNGQQAPEMTLHQSQRQRPKAKQRKKTKNIFSRTYEKLISKLKPHSKPDESPAYEPEGLPDWNQPEFPQPESVVSTPLDLPEPDEPAEIIMPPQPQPNFLPGLDVSDAEDIKPAITEGVETVDVDDPFPLPPLPSEVGIPSAKKQGRTEVVQTPDRTSDKINEFEVSLPLPGIDSPETVTVEIEQPEQEFTEPVQRVVEQEMVEEKTENIAEVQSPHGIDPKSTKESELPPAPSAVLSVSQNRPQLQDPIATELPATYQGWRSRTGQPLPLEPKTLNAPAKARPATLPNPATVHKQAASEKYRRIAERGNRTGFKGFCPVVLRDELELVDASPAFRIEYEGAIYYFSSAEALDKFQQAPVRYAPARGGIDLVKYNTQGVEELGRLDFAVWYHDRLHLFTTQENMEQFKAAPESFISKN